MPKSKLIAFYLPQYHPIKENDEWWGKGFTDWRNVVKGKPRFRKHYQPQIPADLGFYDLRLEETRIAQAELAKKYGIHGFCYYHYWFNGKMLLEKPFNSVLASKKPDFPFCLCWANENWTRRWDGLESEILMEQNYGEYDPSAHMNWLIKAFSDQRYIKIDGKPLFLVYNAAAISNLEFIISSWRKCAGQLGFPDIYLCSVKNVRNVMNDVDILGLGFDALVEFYPTGEKSIPRKISGMPRYIVNKIVNIIIQGLSLEKMVKPRPVTIVHDYNKLADKMIKKPIPDSKTFPCVIPSWDNSARKRVAAVIQNNDAEKYGQWLENALSKVQHNSDDEKIVFINAWNEWAEGCHLEPDVENGRKFLEATLKVVSTY